MHPKVYTLNPKFSCSLPGPAPACLLSSLCNALSLCRTTSHIAQIHPKP